MLLRWSRRSKEHIADSGSEWCWTDLRRKRLRGTSEPLKNLLPHTRSHSKLFWKEATCGDPCTTGPMTWAMKFCCPSTQGSRTVYGDGISIDG